VLFDEVTKLLWKWLVFCLADNFSVLHRKTDAALLEKPEYLPCIRRRRPPGAFLVMDAACLRNSLKALSNLFSRKNLDVAESLLGIRKSTAIVITHASVGA